MTQDIPPWFPRDLFPFTSRFIDIGGHRLHFIDEGEGVPLLIQLAKATRDDQVRKQAMSSLGQSRDGRAIGFFEEVLKK